MSDSLLDKAKGQAEELGKRQGSIAVEHDVPTNTTDVTVSAKQRWKRITGEVFAKWRRKPGKDDAVVGAKVEW
jgi:hypothetical protein